MVLSDCSLWVRSLILEGIWTLGRGSYAMSADQASLHLIVLVCRFHMGFAYHVLYKYLPSESSVMYKRLSFSSIMARFLLLDLSVSFVISVRAIIRPKYCTCKDSKYRIETFIYPRRCPCDK